MTYSKKVSLSEVNQSIDTPNNNRFGKILRLSWDLGLLWPWVTWIQGTGLPVCRRWGDLQVQSAFCHLNFIFNRYAVATNGWEIRDCDPNGLGPSDCLPLAQMVAIHALGDSGACLNGDGFG